MKAKEYVDKYAGLILSKDKEESDKGCANLFIDLFNEVEEIVKTRNAKFDRALYSIIIEQNNKYNAICRLLEKMNPELIVKRDYFKEYCYEKVPGLKEYSSTYRKT